MHDNPEREPQYNVQIRRQWFECPVNHEMNIIDSSVK